jgi:hypothetical protein
MEKLNPILIAGPPRCGTTMIAGLLAQHGVWIGRGRTTNYPGTNPEFVSENQDIKAIMKREALRVGYRNWNTPLPEIDLPLSIKDEIEEFVPDNVPWLVKTTWTLVFSHFWQQAYPDAWWVLVVRDPELVLDSMNRHPGMTKRPDKQKRAFIRALNIRQGILYNSDSKTAYIDVKTISQMDYNELCHLFYFLNITPNWKAIEDWIEPGRMK